MNGRYILNDAGNPEPCDDLMTWGRWMESAERHVAKDVISNATVSTVFLGLDHSFGEVGGPVLYETMIFGGEHADYQERYATREEALAGHQKALELVAGVVKE